jgi:hypothetical protein
MGIAHSPGRLRWILGHLTIERVDRAQDSVSDSLERLKRAAEAPVRVPSVR